MHLLITNPTFVSVIMFVGELDDSVVDGGDEHAAPRAPVRAAPHRLDCARAVDVILVPVHL